MLRIPMALQTLTAARFCGYARTRTRVCLIWHVFGEVVNRNAKDGHRRTRDDRVVLDRPTWFFDRLKQHGAHHTLRAGVADTYKKMEAAASRFEPSMVLRVKFDRQFEGSVCALHVCVMHRSVTFTLSP